MSQLVQSFKKVIIMLQTKSITAYEDSVAKHIAQMLSSDDNTVVISSAKWVVADDTKQSLESNLFLSEFFARQSRILLPKWVKLIRKKKTTVTQFPERSAT